MRPTGRKLAAAGIGTRNKRASMGVVPHQKEVLSASTGPFVPFTVAPVGASELAELVTTLGKASDVPVPVKVPEFP